jgi:hypothetical protein
LEALIVSRDGFIISGNRRVMAAKVAGLKSVPVTVKDVVWVSLTHDEKLRLLREHNRQRIKGFDEMAREALIDTDPDTAWTMIDEQRKKRSQIKGLKPMRLEGFKPRSRLTRAKEDFLDAVLKILAKYPNDNLSERQIHYRLLNDPPLINRNRATSTYANNKTSSDALSRLVTIARIRGQIPFNRITDETRPVTQWDVYPNVQAYMRKEFDELLGNYWRSAMQSQPNHIELLVEKNTVRAVLREVAGRFGILMTSGRGFSSIPPRYKMARRFIRSGKNKLVIIIVSDFDPSGEWIADSFPRSLRDDFGLGDRVVAYRAALTRAQTRGLPESVLTIDQKNNRHSRLFFERYGEEQKPYEVEALEPDVLRAYVTKVIDTVIDKDRYNAEVERSKQDAVKIYAAKKAFLEWSKTYRFDDGDVPEDDDEE